MSGNPTAWSIAEMVSAMHRTEISSVELVRAHLDRIEELDGALNAVAVRDFERAIERAARADRERSAGSPTGPLHGVPFTVKESIEIEGLPLCEGSKLRRPVRSRRDAAVVARLRAAGAVPLGKTNISELAFFPDSTNLVYGSTRNPHDLDRSASGSSGGEAVAVCCGMSAFGIGSDYGGSIRGPAHAVGVVGFRPAPDSVALGGHAPGQMLPGRTTWTAIGPLTRSVRDAEVVWSAVGPNFSPGAAEARDGPLPEVAIMLDRLDRPISTACGQALTGAAEALRERGHRVTETFLPHQTGAEKMFGTVTAAETRHAVRGLLDSAGEEAASLLSPQLAWQWEAVQDLAPDLERYITAFGLRLELERVIEVWQEEHPIVIAPVAATPAYRLGSSEVEVCGRVTEMLDLYASCTFASALSLPAIAVPVARTGDGLPIAVQLIGRRGRESDLFAAARKLEDAFGGWQVPAPY